MILYYVGGSKGGTGKSFVSIALCDYLTQCTKQRVRLIETDTSNPDTGKICCNAPNVIVETIQLDNANGWIKLVDLCDTIASEGHEEAIVVNSAARSNDAVRQHGGALVSALSQLGMDLITLWVINRQRDSLELLHEYMDVIPGQLFVVRNNYFGGSEDFKIYEGSQIKGRVEERGGTLDFPGLNDLIADRIYSERISIAQCVDDTSIFKLGSRTILKRWRRLAWDMFAAITGGGAAVEPK